MAFDEPDTHLDYKSQRQIFDVIKRFAELPAIQVVVCTHSLNFIERVPINRIVHYRLEPSNRTTLLEILSVDNHETTELFMYEISKNMGLRNSVMLHERCFLVIEGSTESAALPVLFYKRFNMPLQSAGICLINGEGNYGARMLVKFLNIHKRQVIFLVDTDAISTDGLQKHFTPASFQTDGIDESNQVHYVGAKEFEDAFSDEHWARMAQANFPKKSGKAWEQADFAVLRSNAKFSKALQALIKQEAMFITLEGPEGSGKTSHIPHLVEFLREKGHVVFPTREPGGTSISEQIRDILHDMKNAEMHPRTETLLYQAARAQIVEQVIQPRLADGEIVISDRYYDSTIAYQGYGHQQNLEDIRALVKYATGGLTPDLTILLDLDIEVGLKRKTQNEVEWNRMDAYTVEFHKRVRAGYLEMVKAEPQRWVVVNSRIRRGSPCRRS
jgi:dTMP kinase